MIRDRETFRLIKLLKKTHLFSKDESIVNCKRKRNKAYSKKSTGGGKSFVNSLNSLRSSPISICGLFKAIFNTAKVAQALSTTWN